jgi:hypothetical protein
MPNCTGGKTEEWKLRYIKKYASKLTASEIEKLTGISVTFIYQYCDKNKIDLKRRRYEKHKYSPEERRPVFIYPEKEKIIWQRPPAVYSNKSREEVIEKYLALEI